MHLKINNISHKICPAEILANILNPKDIDLNPMDIISNIIEINIIMLFISA